MNKYIINVTADIPYPWHRMFEEKATNEGAAISRALRQYRADVRSRNGRAKKIAEATVTFRNCGRVPGGEEVANV